MNNEYYPFEQFLEDHMFGFKHMRYESDIMYKAVCFNKYGQDYKRYCINHGKVGNFDIVKYDIKDYEKRISDAKYAGKIA